MRPISVSLCPLAFPSRRNEGCQRLSMFSGLCTSSSSHASCAVRRGRKTNQHDPGSGANETGDAPPHISARGFKQEHTCPIERTPLPNIGPEFHASPRPTCFHFRSPEPLTARRHCQRSPDRRWPSSRSSWQHSAKIARGFDAAWDGRAEIRAARRARNSRSLKMGRSYQPFCRRNSCVIWVSHEPRG